MAAATATQNKAKRKRKRERALTASLYVCALACSETSFMPSQRLEFPFLIYKNVAAKTTHSSFVLLFPCDRSIIWHHHGNHDGCGSTKSKVIAAIKLDLTTTPSFEYLSRFYARFGETEVARRKIEEKKGQKLALWRKMGEQSMEKQFTGRGIVPRVHEPCR